VLNFLYDARLASIFFRNNFSLIQFLISYHSNPYNRKPTESIFRSQAFAQDVKMKTISRNAIKIKLMKFFEIAHEKNGEITTAFIKNKRPFKLQVAPKNFATNYVLRKWQNNRFYSALFFKTSAFILL